MEMKKAIEMARKTFVAIYNDKSKTGIADGAAIAKEVADALFNLGKALPRNEVYIYAEAMEAELKENDHKGGWKDCSIEFLVSKLHEEVDELIEAVCYGTPERILSEAADIGNIAMMIADVRGALKRHISV